MLCWYKAKFLTITYISKDITLRMIELIGQLFPGNSIGCKIRGALYRPFLKKCGKNFQVALNAKLECLDNIEVEDDVYIGHGCWINGVGGGVYFESQVMLGPYVTMVSGEHVFENGSARFSKTSKHGKIVICFGSWIAAHTTITSGVTIGKSCLIGAGSVVTKDVPMLSLAVGVPAKVIGKSERGN